MIHDISVLVFVASLVVAAYGLLGIRPTKFDRRSYDITDHIPKSTLPVGLACAAVSGVLVLATR